MCGPSDQQNKIEASQADFYNQLKGEIYSVIFAEDQSLLGRLTSAFEPILAAGPSQEGFALAQKQNLESTATNAVGQNYAKAGEALAVRQGAEGGGTTFIPTGAKQQQQREIATGAAQTLAGEEQQITAADYATGRANYEEAANVLGGVAAQYNPTGFASTATGAGSAASTTANEIAQENNSWMGLVAGGLGAAGTAASGYFQNH